MQFIDKYRFVLVVALLFGMFLLISLVNKAKHNMVVSEKNIRLEQQSAEPVSKTPAETINVKGELIPSDTLNNSTIDLSRKKDVVVIVY